MEPGDTVFFHPLLVHGSGVNVSKRTRKAISCHYAAGDCNYIDVCLGTFAFETLCFVRDLNTSLYPLQVTGTVQDTIAKEIKEIARKRYSIEEIDYADVWRLKSSCVRGVRSNL